MKGWGLKIAELLEISGRRDQRSVLEENEICLEKKRATPEP